LDPTQPNHGSTQPMDNSAPVSKQTFQLISNPLIHVRICIIVEIFTKIVQHLLT